MERKSPPGWDEIDKLIKRVDEVCKEAEEARNRAHRINTSKPFWPDRRSEIRDQNEPLHHPPRR